MVIEKTKSKESEKEIYPCPECGSKRTVRNMIYKTKKWGEQARRKCKDCCTTFYENEECRKL